MAGVIARTATAIGKIPHFCHLLAGEAVFLNQELAETAVDIPTPTFTAAGTFFVRVCHRVIVSQLLLWRKLRVIGGGELLGKLRIDVVGVRGDLRNTRVLLETLHLFGVTMEIHWAATGTLKALSGIARCNGLSKRCRTRGVAALAQPLKSRGKGLRGFFMIRVLPCRRPKNNIRRHHNGGSHDKKWSISFPHGYYLRPFNRPRGWFYRLTRASFFPRFQLLICASRLSAPDRVGNCSV